MARCFDAMSLHQKHVNWTLKLGWRSQFHETLSSPDNNKFSKSGMYSSRNKMNNFTLLHMHKLKIIRTFHSTKWRSHRQLASITNFAFIGSKHTSKACVYLLVDTDIQGDPVKATTVEEARFASHNKTTCAITNDWLLGYIRHETKYRKYVAQERYSM